MSICAVVGSSRVRLSHLLRSMTSLLTCVVCSAALAGDFSYTVQPGDHPWNLAQRYLKHPTLSRQLLELNKIEDERHVMPGTRLRIPQKWLRLQTSRVRVLAVFGDITQQKAGHTERRHVQQGDYLQAPLVLRTGATGNATLGFADGSRVLLRRDSELQLKQTQQRALNKVSFVQLFLLSGSMENLVTPMGDSGGRFEIDTPAAVAAVRGTQFRVQVQGVQSRTEVLGGIVNVANSSGQVDTAAGQGTVAQSGQSPAGSLTQLLPEPSLEGLPERIERLPIDVPLKALAGAVAYRTQLAPDESFSVLVSDETSEAARIRARDVDDGSYFLRVRAVDARGLEGFSAQRALLVAARPASPVLIEPAPMSVTERPRPEFRWAQGDAGWHYRLQIMADGSQTPLDEQVVQGGVATALQDLPAGLYQWRVAAIQSGKGQGPWSDAQAFRRVLPGPGVVASQMSDRTTTLRWPGQLQAARYHLQVARESGFAAPLVDVRPEGTQYDLKSLAAGAYHVRVRTIGADGYTGPWGQAQTFVVPEAPVSTWPALLLLLPLLVMF